MASGEEHISVFERIRHTTQEGTEYWSGRELAGVLGYTDWRNFVRVVTKAREACENSGFVAADHIVDVNDMITVGKGAQRSVTNVHLSRYACYLIVQNADPEKPIVALGQTYFAVQTRRQELADEAALAGLDEDQRRLFIRAELANQNRQLADAASVAGIVTSRDFAVFQDHGYMGLYNGEKARDIAARKGLKKGQAILDHMGSTERDDIRGKAAANRTHFEVGRKVRQTIEELGGTMPEELPTPPESIQQLRRKEQKRLEAERQPSLFSLNESHAGEDE